MTILFVGIVFIIDKEINIKLAGICLIIFDIILIISAIRKIKSEINNYNEMMKEEEQNKE